MSNTERWIFVNIPQVYEHEYDDYIETQQKSRMVYYIIINLIVNLTILTLSYFLKDFASQNALIAAVSKTRFISMGFVLISFVAYVIISNSVANNFLFNSISVYIVAIISLSILREYYIVGNVMKVVHFATTGLLLMSFPVTKSYENILLLILYLAGNLAFVSDMDIIFLTYIPFSVLISAVYINRIDNTKRNFLIMQKHEETKKDLVLLNKELEELSETDQLTKLMNRRAFDKNIELRWDLSKRSEMFFTVFMIDIDNFKKYNDTYGHPEGDKCLIQVANVIRSIFVRSTDLVARYGGEEFIIVVPSYEQEYAIQMAERVRVEVEAMQIPHAKSPTNQYVTVSVGVASRLPSAIGNYNDLVLLADQSLYAAKNAGRNRVAFDVNSETSFSTLVEKKTAQSATYAVDDIGIARFLIEDTMIFTFNLDVQEKTMELSANSRQYFVLESLLLENYSFFEARIYSEDLPRFSRAIISMLRTKSRSESLYLRILQKSGTFLWTSLKLVYFRPSLEEAVDTGRTDQIVGAFSDVSKEMRRYLEALLIIKSFAQYTFSFNFDLKLARVNDELKNLFNFKRNSVDLNEIGEFLQQFSQSDILSYVTAFKDLFTGKKKEIELFFRVENDEIGMKVYSFRGVIERDEFGNPQVIAGVVSDLAEEISKYKKELP